MSMKQEQMTKNEEWKTIEGFPSYKISTEGRVLSLRNPKNPKYLKMHLTAHGYYSVTLSSGETYGKGKKHTVQVHRLVAQNFIPNPQNLPYTDHIDTNRLNNSVSNLRWVDPKGNSNNPITLERVREHNKQMAKEASKMVLVYDEGLNLLSAFTSTSQCSKMANLSQGNVQRCCSGELKRYGGLIFSYKPLFSMEERIELEESEKATKRRSKVLKCNYNAMNKWLSKEGNREVYNERARRYYQTHKEDFKRRAKEWYDRNKRKKKQ